MLYIFWKLWDQGTLWWWDIGVMGWNKAARNFVFAPDSNWTLIWHLLISTQSWIHTLYDSMATHSLESFGIFWEMFLPSLFIYCDNVMHIINMRSGNKWWKIVEIFRTPEPDSKRPLMSGPGQPKAPTQYLGCHKANLVLNDNFTHTHLMLFIKEYVFVQDVKCQNYIPKWPLSHWWAES